MPVPMCSLGRRRPGSFGGERRANVTDASALTLPASYFDAVYAADDDPWRFETSAYEAAKYADSVAALGDRRFASAFEIGCSIGVLTRSLAVCCEQLFAVDISEAALRQARRRCADLPQVEFDRIDVTREFPQCRFDLVVMSEVGYYWSRPDLDRVLERIAAALLPGGLLLLVHWIADVADYPLRGDDVHEAALGRATADGAMRPVSGWRRENYRLDLLERRHATAAAPVEGASR